MKPILKYRGGKSSEIKYFIDYIPKHYNTYIEPFVGGGAVYFYLEPRHSIINDINPKLMNFYHQLRDNYTEFRSQLTFLQNIYDTNQLEYEKTKLIAPDIRIENKNEELYYDLRRIFNYPSDKWLEGVIYFFINKTAYSGMIRYNKSGEYNVPFGRYKNFNTALITDSHHKLLMNTQLFNIDYSEIFNMAGTDDFIFLDPPYDCVFNDYGNLENENGFNEEEHTRLAQNFRNLRCKALMVISKTDLTLDLYRDFIIDEYDKNYSVNIRNRFKNTAKHLIITNF